MLGLLKLPINTVERLDVVSLDRCVFMSAKLVEFLHITKIDGISLVSHVVLSNVLAVMRGM